MIGITELKMRNFYDICVRNTISFIFLFPFTLFANTFTASLPPSASAVMGTGSTTLSFTITHTGTTRPIYRVWFYFNPGVYCPSYASSAPSGWTVENINCTAAISRIIFSTSTSPINPGESKIFNLFLQGPGYGLIPRASQDILDSTTQIRAYDINGVQLTYQGSQPSWIRRSIYASAFLSPSSAGLGEDIFLQLYIKNNSTSTQSLILPSSPSPHGSGSATLKDGPFPSSVTLAPLEEAIFSWTYTSIGPGELYYIISAGNGSATSDPVESNTIIIGTFTSSLHIEPERAVSGWNITVRMVVSNNGEINLGDIRPGALIPSGTAILNYVSGPEPESLFQLSPGSSGTFEWVYEVSGLSGDTFQFSGMATAEVQGINTNLANSNVGEIVNYALEISPSSVPSGSTNVTLYFTFYNNGPSPIDLIYIVTSYPGWTYQAGSGRGDYLGCVWNANDFTGYVRFLPPDNSCRIPVGGAGQFSITFTQVPSVTGDAVYTFITNVRDSSTLRLVVLKANITVTSYSLSLSKIPSGPLPADGTSFYTLTAYLTNNGNPVEGKLVNFSTTAGTLSSNSAYTDSQGKAVVLLYAPVSSEDVSGYARASCLSASDQEPVSFAGVRGANLQYVGGTLFPREAQKGSSPYFSLLIYNAGTTSITLTSDSYFFITDGITPYASYLSSPVFVDVGTYETLIFGPRQVSFSLSGGSYFPQIYLTDGNEKQVRNAGDDLFIYFLPSLTSVVRVKEKGDVIVYASVEKNISYEVLYKNSFLEVWSTAGSITAPSENIILVDDGSLTGSHPSSVKERYYALKISGKNIKTREVAGSFRIEVSDKMTLVSFPLLMMVNRPDDIFQEQLAGDISPSQADRIWFWDTSSGKYRYIWKFDSNGGYPEWDDRWFEGLTLTSLTLNPDEGFFVQSRHGIQSFQIVGFVSSTNREKNIIKGLQMIGSTYPLEVTLGVSGLRESGASGSTSPSRADRIWFWDPDLQRFRYAWLFDSGGKYPQFDRKWLEGYSDTTIRLKPGYGYFFQDRLNDFIWVYPKPYEEP